MATHLDPSRVTEIEREAERFRTKLTPALRLLSAYFSPVLHGIERVPEQGPVLLVGNHTVTGAFDTAVMIWELWRRRGIQVFALGDHFHFRVPLWRDLMSSNATVPGTRVNCGTLLDTGRHVLVFPGGGREVCKRKGEKYELMWKERTGFASMALQHGATVVPFGAVGGEELYDIVVDSADVLGSPLGPLCERVQRALGLPRDEIMPVVTGIGPLPKPTRLYYEFGEPIRPGPWNGRLDDPAAARELRDLTRASVQACLHRLLAEQGADPLRDLRARTRSDLSRLLASARRGRVGPYRLVRPSRLVSGAGHLVEDPLQGGADLVRRERRRRDRDPRHAETG